MAENTKDITKLPTDILIEIISRLPAKFFYRLKTISKKWYIVSSNPYLRNKLPQIPLSLVSELVHLDKHSTIKLTSISNTELLVDTMEKSLPFEENQELLDCCNGLILCCCRSIVDQVSRFYVSNPAILDYMILPEPNDHFGRLVLAFDPNVSLEFSILNFQSTEVDWDERVVTNLEIYSSKTRKWRESGIKWGYDIEIGYSGNVFLNEMVHLAGKDVILSVDQEGTSYETTPSPEQKVSWPVRLGKFEGNLLYASSYPEIKIWILDNFENKNWILKHRINTTNFFGRDLLYSRHSLAYAIALDQLRDVIYIIAPKEDDKTIISYDLQSGETDEICFLHGSILERNSFYFVPCYADCFGNSVDTNV